MDLARWLVDPSHPLTSRVAVNRFWGLFFPNPIVRTANEFGTNGQPPTHPELLDWLGRRLTLQWIEVEREAPQAAPDGGGGGAGVSEVLPKLEVLRTLEEQIHAGYIRGVHKVLDQIATAQPECEAFVARMRVLARQFQLDVLARQVEEALHTADAAPKP